MDNWGKRTERGKTPDLPTIERSADYCLAVGDLDKFRAGRPMSDILEDIQWRFGSVEAADCEGTSVCSISYKIRAEKRGSGSGTWVHAIFVADKFAKFIRWLPHEMQEIDYEGAKWSRPKPTKLGDCSWLMRAMNSQPVSVEGLQTEATLTAAPTCRGKSCKSCRTRVDWGLTIVYYSLLPLFLPSLLLESGRFFLRARHRKINAQLRDQFNAARLKIGMTEPEVQFLLMSDPIESGRIEAGSYKIYGANKSFDYLDPCLHFSNIVVAFREGKATVVQSISAAGDWRGKLAEAIIDLPMARASKPED